MVDIEAYYKKLNRYIYKYEQHKLGYVYGDLIGHISYIEIINNEILIYGFLGRSKKRKITYVN